MVFQAPATRRGLPRQKRKSAKGIDKSHLLLYNTSREATDGRLLPLKQFRNNRPKLSQGWRAVISFSYRYDGHCPWKCRRRAQWVASPRRRTAGKPPRSCTLRITSPNTVYWERLSIRNVLSQWNACRNGGKQPPPYGRSKEQSVARVYHSTNFAVCQHHFFPVFRSLSFFLEIPWQPLGDVL